MGKHERAWAEEAEIAVTEAINDPSTATPHIRHIADSIASHVEKHRPGDVLARAVWTGGGDYKDPGDIRVELASGELVRIETKFSHGQGSGTRKNPKTSILKKKLDKNIITYEQFDEDNGFRKIRYGMLSERLGQPVTRTADYETNLRILRDAGDPFIDQIIEATVPSQSGYAEYAAGEMNKHLSKLNEWVGDLLGIKDEGRPTVDQELVYCIIRGFESPKQTVEFLDCSEVDTEIVNVVTSGKSIKCMNQFGKCVIRFSVNWKNICQGGQNPAFNIFIGNIK